MQNTQPADKDTFAYLLNILITADQYSCSDQINTAKQKGSFVQLEKLHSIFNHQSLDPNTEANPTVNERKDEADGDVAFMQEF